MAETAFCTTALDCSVERRASSTIWLASVARSVEFFTAAVISSSAAEVSSREAACCSVRLDNSPDAVRISPAPPLMVSIATRTWPSRVTKVCHGVVDVVSQFGKSTLEVTMHASRQIAVRKGGDDAAGFCNTAIDGGDQLVDLSREPVEIDIVVVLGNALGEVAGHGCRDHLTDIGLQICALCLQRCLLGVHLTPP